MSAERQPKRGRPSSVESDQMVERVVETAFRHFATHGFERANLSGIAREAGVTRQMIYGRYRDKRGMFEAATAAQEARLFHPEAIGRFESASDLRSALQEFSALILDYLLHPDRIDLSRALLGGLHRFPDLAEVEQAARERVHLRLARILADASGGALGRTAALQVVEDLTASLHGACFPVLLGCRPPYDAAQRQRLTTRLVERMVDSIEANVRRGGPAT